jgi:hypothetical protein
MRGVSPEVVCHPRLFFIGSVGPDMLCWRPVWVGILLVESQFRRTVCRNTEEPV